MDYADHIKSGTSSWGSGAAAQAYRNEQRSVADKAGVMAAMAMDIFDIQANHGSKYNAAISEAIAYATCLEAADAAQKGKK